MQIRPADRNDVDAISELIARFRVTLAEFKGWTREPDIESGKKEFFEYLEKNYPIYVAIEDSKMVGYIVCRVEDGVVWAESLYVLPEYRRRGIGTALYEKAEELAEDLGEDTVYNWVHPNNDVIISFLKNRGYSVLNLIELRRRWKGEKTSMKIKVGKHEFDY